MSAWARGTAGFFGLFFLVGSLVHGFRPEFDLTIWCLDLRWLPTPVAIGFSLLLGVVLLVIASGQCTPSWSCTFTRWMLGLTIGIALANALLFGRMLAAGSVHSLVPVPSTAIWAVALATALAGISDGRWAGTVNPRASAENSPLIRYGAMAIGLFWMALFPVIQVYCFGGTDYRRRADVAVVFGARVHADGSLSQALADRVDTAVRLYQQGWVPHLWFSGGPGDGRIHETEAMRRRAIELGVRAGDISLDSEGFNTAATVRNAGNPWFGRRVIAVSEFYHLPRIKLAFAAAGRDVYTVPAEPSHWLRRWALGSVLREVPAFWTYYCRAVIQSLSPSQYR